ncbi:PDDEXK nuclease domain-containing protein [Algoriphagus sp. C2-6-M1]|uniref:PDDEXK nuclease domain-containing protein n=1 Tax=Algoriphagus persicinus TaxID=3108754 RepID=UPI002B3A29BA|nr:PDDEXK nuclease domain-containing protein [Algoriphagus sp. C2-6-M1]MEB2782150.1 PDDEXK nuclease domain-containing protein [Algoriphagus sp. C2-6-M1]
MEATIELIKQLKQRILTSRYLVAKMANAESLRLYFTIGHDLDAEIKTKAWGDKVLAIVAARLQQELPGLRGFSTSNLKKMRLFYNAWAAVSEISSSLTNQLENSKPEMSSLSTNQFEANDFSRFISIGFTHHVEIILKTEKAEDRWYYINQSAVNFWTVNHLRSELINKSHLQQINLSNNFSQVLPKEISNKAIRAFKDQYLLDYVNVEDGDDEIDERVLERELVLNIKKFLMSLGNDFSFMGNQYRILVEEDEYFIDLLFFHRGLQSLIAFELKRGKFKPEYIGKMNFYLSALDDLVRKPHENPSIGIILCKEKDQKKVEYSFRDFSKPLGVATYQTSETLPPQLKDALPDAETLKKLME